MNSPAATAQFRSAVRINHSLTAGAEKKVLVWIASRVPKPVTSDHLTLLGFVAEVGAGACYALAHHHRFALLGVILCIVLNWLGDSLDGTLARERNLQRPRYGFYVDHMVDILGATALMVGLGFSGFLHWQTAIAMLIAFLLLSSEAFLAAGTLSRFQLSQGIFGPTEIRILLVIGTAALLRSPYAVVLGHRLFLFDLGGIVSTLGMLSTLIIVTGGHMVQLYREEPLPR